MLKRFAWVVLFSGVIGSVLWAISSGIDLTTQLIYTYATALPIWFLTDPIRARLFPSPTHELALNWRIWSYIGCCVALGFMVGTSIGDGYAGWSTLDLWRIAPQKLVGLIVMCATISVAFFIFFYQQNRLYHVQHQAVQSKLQLLQSQLEPHMLFNTLSNLRALIDLDPTRAQTMLDRLIDYLRATLGASRVTSHALALEFARLDDYLALMQIRMGDRLCYQLKLPKELESLACPALLLQPLVENAVLHGLEPCTLGGAMTISAARVGSNLHLTVSDTGAGMQMRASTDPSKGGFGLTHLQERLQTLYLGRASIQTQNNRPHGITTTICLPLT